MTNQITLPVATATQPGIYPASDKRVVDSVAPGANITGSLLHSVSLTVIAESNTNPGVNSIRDITMLAGVITVFQVYLSATDAATLKNAPTTAVTFTKGTDEVSLAILQVATFVAPGASVTTVTLDGRRIPIDVTFPDSFNTGTISASFFGSSAVSIAIPDIGDANQVLTVNSAGTSIGWEDASDGGGNGSSTLIGLTDTPSEFGTEGQVLVVNSDTDGMEFADQSGGGGVGPSGVTNLGIDSRSGATLDVTSSTGTDATVPAADGANAGLMRSVDFVKLGGIEASADVNVDTDLDIGASNATNVTITSSTGTGASLGPATTTVAGLESAADKAKLDDIEASADVNVATDLTSTGTANTVTIESSTGDNVTLEGADAAGDAGLMTRTDKGFLNLTVLQPNGWIRNLAGGDHSANDFANTFDTYIPDRLQEFQLGGNYVENEVAYYHRVLYLALTDITGASTVPSQDPTNWREFSTHRLEGYGDIASSLNASVQLASIDIAAKDSSFDPSFYTVTPTVTNNFPQTIIALNSNDFIEAQVDTVSVNFDLDHDTGIIVVAAIPDGEDDAAATISLILQGRVGSSGDWTNIKDGDVAIASGHTTGSGLLSSLSDVTFDLNDNDVLHLRMEILVTGSNRAAGQIRSNENTLSMEITGVNEDRHVVAHGTGTNAGHITVEKSSDNSVTPIIDLTGTPTYEGPLKKSRVTERLPQDGDDGDVLTWDDTNSVWEAEALPADGATTPPRSVRSLTTNFGALSSGNTSIAFDLDEFTGRVVGDTWDDFDSLTVSTAHGNSPNYSTQFDIDIGAELNATDDVVSVRPHSGTNENYTVTRTSDTIMTLDQDGSTVDVRIGYMACQFFGTPGTVGPTGAAGADGEDGEDGDPGADGVDGVITNAVSFHMLRSKEGEIATFTNSSVKTLTVGSDDFESFQSGDTLDTFEILVVTVSDGTSRTYSAPIFIHIPSEFAATNDAVDRMFSNSSASIIITRTGDTTLTIEGSDSITRYFGYAHLIRFGFGARSLDFVGLTDTPSSLTAGKILQVNTDGDALEEIDLPTGTTNLSLTGRDTDSLDIDSSTGTDVTVPSATTLLAGLESAADKTKLDGIETGAEVNVGTNLTFTASDTVAAFSSSTGTPASVLGASGTAAGLMVADDKTKLDGIETGAQVNVDELPAVTGDDNDQVLTVVSGDWAAADAAGGSGTTNLAVASRDTDSLEVTSSTGTDAEIPSATTLLAGLESAADKTKLDGIETSATADQTDAEIKTAYENNSDTNAFTDDDEDKLDGITPYASMAGRETHAITFEIVSTIPNALNEIQSAAGNDITSLVVYVANADASIVSAQAIVIREELEDSIVSRKTGEFIVTSQLTNAVGSEHVRTVFSGYLSEETITSFGIDSFSLGSVGNDVRLHFLTKEALTTYVPSFGTAGVALGYDSDGVLGEVAYPNELPDTLGDADQVLTVNSGANGVGWEDGYTGDYDIDFLRPTGSIFTLFVSQNALDTWHTGPEQVRYANASKIFQISQNTLNPTVDYTALFRLGDVIEVYKDRTAGGFILQINVVPVAAISGTRTITTFTSTVLRTLTDVTFTQGDNLIMVTPYSVQPAVSTVAFTSPMTRLTSWYNGSWENVFTGLSTTDVNEGGFTINAVSGDDRVVIPEDGVYQIRVTYHLDTSNDSGSNARFVPLVRIRQNRSGTISQLGLTKTGYSRGQYGSLISQVAVDTSDIAELEAGDEIWGELEAYRQQGSTTATVDGLISIVKLGGATGAAGADGADGAAGAGVPTPIGTAGQVVAVNSGETATEWVDGYSGDYDIDFIRPTGAAYALTGRAGSTDPWHTGPDQVFPTTNTVQLVQNTATPTVDYSTLFRIGDVFELYDHVDLSYTIRQIISVPSTGVSGTRTTVAYSTKDLRDSGNWLGPSNGSSITMTITYAPLPSFKMIRSKATLADTFAGDSTKTFTLNSTNFDGFETGDTLDVFNVLEIGLATSSSSFYSTPFRIDIAREFSTNADSIRTKVAHSNTSITITRTSGTVFTVENELSFTEYIGFIHLIRYA